MNPDKIKLEVALLFGLKGRYASVISSPQFVSDMVGQQRWDYCMYCSQPRNSRMFEWYHA